MSLTLNDRRLLVELGVILLVKLLILFSLKIIFFSSDHEALPPHPGSHFFQRAKIHTQAKTTASPPSTKANKEL